MGPLSNYIAVGNWVYPHVSNSTANIVGLFSLESHLGQAFGFLSDGHAFLGMTIEGRPSSRHWTQGCQPQVVWQYLEILGWSLGFKEGRGLGRVERHTVHLPKGAISSSSSGITLLNK